MKDKELFKLMDDIWIRFRYKKRLSPEAHDYKELLKFVITNEQARKNWLSSPPFKKDDGNWYQEIGEAWMKSQLKKGAKQI